MLNKRKKLATDYLDIPIEKVMGCIGNPWIALKCIYEYDKYWHKRDKLGERKE